MEYSTAILLVAIVVAVLLPFSAFTATPSQQPYEERTQGYAIAHESTEAFTETLAERHLDTNDSVPIDDHSAETQRAFAEMNSQPPDSQGWQSADIEICADGMLVCDAYAEKPDFQTTAEEHPSMAVSNAYGLLEHEGDEYVVVVTVRHPGPLPLAPAFDVVQHAIVFTLYGVFIAGFAYRWGGSDPLLTLAATGWGIVLITWPYLVMYTDLDVSPAPLTLAVLLAGAFSWMLLEGREKE